MANWIDKLNSRASGGQQTNTSGGASPWANRLNESSKYIVEEYKKKKKIDSFNRARENAQRAAQEAEQAQTISAKAGEYIFGGGLKETAKSIFGQAKEYVKQKDIEAQQSIQERGKLGTILESSKGALKNIAELGTGSAKLALGLRKESGYSTIRKVLSVVGGKPVEQFLDRATPEYQKTVGAWVDNNGILNYKPEYSNEIQKTGGQVAEIGSYFLPVGPAGKGSKMATVLEDIPKVSGLLGIPAKFAKIGGKLSFEVSSDLVDSAVLDAIRGKTWSELKEDLKYTGIGSATLHGAGMTVGGLLKLGRANRIVNEIEQGVGRLDDAEKVAATRLIDEGRTTDDIATEIMATRESAGKNIYSEPVEDVLVREEKAAEAKAAEKVEVPTAGVDEVKVKTPVAKTEVKESVTPKTTVAKEAPVKKTESPVLKRLNERLDEAHRVDPNLDVKTHKEQNAKAIANILEDPKKAYRDAVFGGGEQSDTLRTTTMVALFENASIKNDQKAMAEIGTALAKHVRRTGQESEAAKAMIQGNPVNKAILDLANAKLQSVAARFKKLKSVAKAGEDISDTAVRIVKNKAKQILLKERKLKVDTARNLIKSLTC